jgi:ABC-type lipoprotein export system ATPase subunit
LICEPQSYGFSPTIFNNLQISTAPQTNRKKSELLKPFTVLSNLIKDIFRDKGIKITTALTLGEASEAIMSDKLSAGEKQMLSFLCYCIFTENSIIFIDEPELSLHPDWQRTLIPTLMEISSTNQFFIATHSPFIYSKYPDKEIVLDIDKGGE